MQPASLQLAMFDMAGTTIDDNIDGTPLMIFSMVRAFAKHGFKLTPDQANRHRGKEKREAIERLLREDVSLPSDEVDRATNQIYHDFVRELEQNLSQVKEIDGATALFRYLKSRGIRVGVGSGFPAQIVEQLVAQLGWRDKGLVDYVGSAETVGVGRPDPRMIYDAMQILGVNNPREVIKVGDTVVDVQEGKNAGTWTVGVLSGSQTEAQLKAAAPDYILPSIRELLTLFDEIV